MIRYLMLLCCALSISSRAQKLEIKPLTGNYYIYTTWQPLDGGDLYPANGMYVITSEGALLMDAPWDTTQLAPPADSIRARHGKEIIFCLATHFHADRTNGLEYYEKKGARCWSTARTLELCKKKGMPQAAHTFAGDTTFMIGGTAFQVFYPGAGHAPDNIVVWFPAQKILYGGCFIKSAENENIGHLGDADTKSWETAIQKVIGKYPNVRYVIPGHQGWGSTTSLQHTLEVVKKYNREHSVGR